MTGNSDTTNPTLAAIVGTLLPEEPELEPARRREVEAEVTRYLANQMAAMSPVFQPLYRVALTAFATTAVPLHGRPFASLSAEKRARHLQSWSDAPIGAMRDFVKLIRSTALLVYFDHPIVRRQLDAERGEREDRA